MATILAVGQTGAAATKLAPKLVQSKIMTTTPASLQAAYSAPKPDTTVIGSNVLLNQTPVPTNNPLPAGNAGLPLPAGVNSSDMPAAYTDGAPLTPQALPGSLGNISPTITKADVTAIQTQPKNAVPVVQAAVATPDTLTAGDLALPDFTSPKTLIIGVVVLILIIIAIKHRHHNA